MSFARRSGRHWRHGGVALLATLVLATEGAGAADLASIVVVPERGQSPDQTRRDRYECHNRALAQTGPTPLRAPPSEVVEAQARAERIGRVAIGAGIGALAGSVIRGSHGGHAAEGALAGGMLGAIVGAIAGRKQRPPVDPAFEAYARALGACLEGRGYVVRIPE